MLAPAENAVANIALAKSVVTSIIAFGEGGEVKIIRE